MFYVVLVEGNWCCGFVVFWYYYGGILFGFGILGVVCVGFWDICCFIYWWWIIVDWFVEKLV